MTNENQLAVITAYDHIQDPIEAAIKLGETFFRCGMFGCNKPEQGTMLALACIAKKQDPFELKRKFHLIDGNLTMRSDAMLAEFRVRGGKVKWKKWDAQEAAADFIWEGETYAMSFTIKDATERNLLKSKDGKLKDNWLHYRPNMLRSRLITETIRMIAPEIIAGIYTPEELDELPSPRGQEPLEKMADAVVVDSIAPRPAPEPTAAELKVSKTAIVLVQRLEALLEEYEPYATTYFVEKGYIRAGQTFRDVNPIRGDKMLNAPSPLLAGIIRRKQAEELQAAKTANDAGCASAQQEMPKVDPDDIPF